MSYNPRLDLIQRPGLHGYWRQESGVFKSRSAGPKALFRRHLPSIVASIRIPVRLAQKTRTLAGKRALLEPIPPNL